MNNLEKIISENKYLKKQFLNRQSNHISPISWIGGKTKGVKKITKFFPNKMDLFVEPFAGSLAVSLKLIQEKRIKKLIINDINSDLTNFWKDLTNDKILKNYPYSDNFENIKSIFQLIPKTNKKGWEFLLHNRLAFSGKENGSFSKVRFQRRYHLNGVLSRVLNCKKLLNLVKTEIFNIDYQEIIKKYDSENTYFYFDPPYPEVSKNCYTYQEINYQELFEICQNLKGKFVLSLNDKEFARQLFNNFNLFELDKFCPLNIQKDKNKSIRKELIITNFTVEQIKIVPQDRNDYWKNYYLKNREKKLNNRKQNYEKNKIEIKDTKIPEKYKQALKYWTIYFKNNLDKKKLNYEVDLFKNQTLNRFTFTKPETYNWNLKKALIKLLPFGLKASDPSFIPCLTKTPNIPIKFNFQNNGFEYLPFAEFMKAQTFPTDFKFPNNMSLPSKFGYLGDSICVKAVELFLNKQVEKYNIKDEFNFIDLFSGIGGFHLVLNNYQNSKCILANDKNKKSKEIYNLNFQNTPFLLGNFQDLKIREEIKKHDFNMITAGFPCQPFSNASGKKIRKRKDEITPYLLKFISETKPKYLLLENVPALTKTDTFKTILEELSKNYQVNYEIINPLKLKISIQNRPRLLIFGLLKRKENKNNNDQKN